MMPGMIDDDEEIKIQSKVLTNVETLDIRTSQTVGQRLSQTNLLSMFGSGKERVEHVHVKVRTSGETDSDL